jgi:hypothetical protein
MIEKNQFKSLTDKIISSIYLEHPEQQLVYKLEGIEWIDALYNNQPIEEHDVKTSLEGGATIQDIIQCMSVIVGTYKMFKELYTTIKTGLEKKKEKTLHATNDIHVIKNEWKQKLIKENIDEVTANKIVEEFSAEINQF